MVATPVLAPSLPGWDDEEVVPENLIMRLYRAGEERALTLTAGLSAHRRALIAAYCYRRSHLHRLGLVIASTLDQATLVRMLGAGLGTAFFLQSRECGRDKASLPGAQRAKVTLAKSTGLPPGLHLVVPDDGDDALDGDATDGQAADRQ
jgi:hypothetical protein